MAKQYAKFEPILHTLPIINAFPELLVDFKKVQKITKSNSLSDSWFLISFHGIFLFSRRKFPRNLYCSHCIPLVDLSFIKLTKSYISFKGKNNKSFSISHPKFIKFASQVYYLHELLFNHPRTQFSFEVDNSVQNEFNDQLYEFDSDSLLADRFLSCLIRETNAFDEHVARNIYNKLKTNKQMFEITGETAACSLISPICYAISYDSEITDFKLCNLSMPAFIPHLSVIFKNSKSIACVIMKKVDFSGHYPESVDDLFKTDDPLFTASDFIFEDCIFDNNSISFFDSFAHYKSEVKVISFQNCTFAPGCIESIFQPIFFNHCFHSMTAFLINGCKYPNELLPCLVQLGYCDWVLRTHCLQTLSVRDCSLQLELLIPQLFQADCGFCDLDLSSNVFNGEFSMTSFNSVANFNLSYCKFDGNSLFSLFKALSLHKRDNVRIDCCSLIIEQDQWDIFFSRIGSLIIPKLFGLSLDNNCFSEENFERLCLFLCNQPNLKELSLSKCVVNKPKMISALLKLVSMNLFESFSLASNSPPNNGEYLGVGMIPILKELLKSTDLRYLNINNQMVTDDGLYSIIELMPQSLNELRFDNFAPSNATSLIDICSQILEKPSIIFASWPSSDEKPALTKTPVQKRHDYGRQITELRLHFIKKYGKESTGCYDSELTSTLMSRLTTTKTRARKPSQKRRRSIKTSIKENIEKMEAFVEYDKETLAMLNECGELLGVDPTISLLKRLEENFSIQKLTEEIVI